MRNLTIRNVPDDLANALEKEKSRRKGSLNVNILAVNAPIIWLHLPGVIPFAPSREIDVHEVAKWR